MALAASLVVGGLPLLAQATSGSMTGPAQLNRMITGSEDLAPRPVLTCNPNLSRSDRNINEFINTSCFSPASNGSLGMDSGYDNITSPGINQWDMSLYKNVSIREKARIQLRLEAFNAFNHTEWGGVTSTILFDSAGTVKNLPSQLGGGGLGFGALRHPCQQPAHLADRGQSRLLIHK
jgi:hypothetical protein